jgi:transposase InsO family protein
MPWKEMDAVCLRAELVSLASAEGANVRLLCRRFGVSPKTAYKWIGRFEVEGRCGLLDRPRRPAGSPERTPPRVELAVLAVRDEHPVWGGRKIRARLVMDGLGSAPAASTITEILRRRGRIDPAVSEAARPWTRFEHDSPNDLWQMDFKGRFSTARGDCHALTVIDDHSRYAVVVDACADERTETVKSRLTGAFRRSGLPWRMLMDNGAPWGDDAEHVHTPLTVWLMRLGIGVVHSRPYHPETQGKDERFHRTLKAEVISGRSFLDLDHCQRAFDEWRPVYNFERPHESLGMNVPAGRWRPSPREYPELLPPVEYGPGEQLRRVQARGRISYRGREWRVPKAFRGQTVAVRPSPTDGVLDVCFLNHRIGIINLNPATAPPEQ